MLIEILRPDFEFEDERGTLIQLVREGYGQVNFITSCAGALRGGHYHKQNDEAFYVIKGKFHLTVSKDVQTEHYNFKKKDFFKIPAGVEHSFEFHTETCLISLYSKGVELENGGKDIYEGGTSQKPK